MDRPRAASVRMDMHVHTRASDKPVIAALAPLNCPESFSPPERVYDQAKARGMDLVTITDHDTIDGALELRERGFEDFVIGEEVTVHFPEDRCKLHVLVWSLTPEQHEQIGDLGLRDDVYAFADWLTEHHLPHAFAHPLYVGNDKLTLWHLERATLLFKGFELLNGAHAETHRDTLTQWLADLTPARVQRLIEKHDLQPRWSRIWLKATTAGSDDHALLNVGCTWTEVSPVDRDAPPSPEEFLSLVMQGRSTVGGQPGHSALLAHQLLTVGLNYYADRWHDALPARGRKVGSTVLRFAGVPAPAPSRPALILDTVRKKFSPRRRRTPPILDALASSLGPLLSEFDDIRAALVDPDSPRGPALSDHERMAEFTDTLTERLSVAMATPSGRRARRLDKAGVVDAAISYGSLLALQAPHIFSLFHQNKERRFLRQIEDDLAASTGAPPRTEESMRVMLFTDTLGDVNGVCRFIQNMGAETEAAGRELHIATSTRFPTPDEDYITNARPVVAMPMPGYRQLELALPPFMRLLRLADRFQPDVIHISTPGPVGLIGLLAAKMLRAPVVGVYHTDFPAFVDRLFEDSVYTKVASDYMRAFYSSFRRILSRSEDYMESLEALGLPRDRMLRLLPGCALETFQPKYRDPGIWANYRGVEPDSVKVLYCGRVSVEKNLPLLTKVWPAARAQCAARGVRIELIVVGDGPYRKQMQRELAGKGAHFLGFKHGEELSTLYASSDVFVFPSTTDTLGQVVLESQSSGIPVIVSDQGGPKEVVAEGVSGFILPGEAPERWTAAIVDLATDEERRLRMGRSAHTRAQRFSIRGSFEDFWKIHAAALREDQQAAMASASGSSRPVSAKRRAASYGPRGGAPA